MQAFYDKTVKSFWKKVDIKGKDECWEWRSFLSDNGYGLIRIANRNWRAHRVSWMLANGLIPEGKCILHKCDNRKCVNPNHLYCGTQSDNIQDRMRRNPMTSEELHIGKLYEGEIWLIKKLLSSRRFSQSLISKMFKINRSTVCRMNKGKKALCREGYFM